MHRRFHRHFHRRFHRRFAFVFPLILAFLLAACAPGTGDANPATGLETQAAPTLSAVMSQATAKPGAEAVSPAATLNLSATAAPGQTAPEQGALPCSSEPTPPDQEGPFFFPGSPQRTSLIEPGMDGEPVLLTGRVFDLDCNPIQGAIVDFWQTDASGEYDNEGYRLRGHAVTGPDGGFSMETIIPGEYPGRPAHIHVKVVSQDFRELLTTQLYFAGSQGSPPRGVPAELVLQPGEPDAEGRRPAQFNFVVRN